MNDPVTVRCPHGHEIRTRARRRGVQCSACGSTVYVRADGTAREPPPAGRGAGQDSDAGPPAQPPPERAPAAPRGTRRRRVRIEHRSPYPGLVPGDPFDLA